jgi:hypothetical protein
MQPTERPIGWWLKHLDRLIDNAFAESLGDIGLRREWQILNIVSRGAATYDEIAEALAPFWDRAGTELDPVLDELQGRGLVEPDADGTWTITSTGSSVRDAAGERVGSIRDRLADGITAEQYEQTIAVLSTMAADLEQSPSR